MDALCPLLGALFLGLAVAFILSKRLFMKPEPANLPRGNMGWPFIGQTLDYLKPHTSHSVGAFLQEHCSRYGKVFKSHLFGGPTIISCDLELNVFVLQNEEKLFQCCYPKAMHGILGNFSLLIAHDELHRKLRGVIVGLISTSKSSSEFLNYIEKLSLSMMESWNHRKEVVFCNEAKMFTFNLIVKYVLSIEAGEPLAAEIFENFRTYMKGFVSLPLYVPGMPFAKAVQARGRISSIVRGIIKERERGNEVITKGDFLDVILSKGLSDDEEVSIVLDLLLGGYETTAILMGLIVFFLERALLALEQLKEEHQAIRKNKEEGEPLTWEDYKQMNFTLCVISEALRCGNVVKFVHRKAIQDVKFKGYLIPAGWKVLPVFTATHLDSSLHENPTEFNPWRWTDQATSRKVTPFGGGLRHCPGAELAKVEVAFFLHHLVLNYRWKTKPDELPLAYPYVEFQRDLLMEIEPVERIMGEKQ